MHCFFLRWIWLTGICHTHTSWTTRYPSLSLKILHFRCMIQWKSNSLLAPVSISTWPSLPKMTRFPLPVLYSIQLLRSLGTKDTPSGQTNGFSPVWILRCTFNSLLRLNCLSQSGQTNGFSPVWNSTMHIQVATSFELLVTIWTDEWLFTGVNSTNAHSNGCFVWTACHNLDRRMAFLQCEFYDAHSSRNFVWTARHNLDRQMAFLQCEFYDAHSFCYFVWTACHNLDRRLAFHQYEFYDA